MVKPKHFRKLASTNFYEQERANLKDITVPTVEYASSEFLQLRGRTSVIQILSELRADFVVSTNGAVNVCAGISGLLGCPILSNNPELFFLSNPQNMPHPLSPSMIHEPSFAPLNFMGFTPKPENPYSYGLKLRIHDPESSQIAHIPPPCRKLVSLLMNEEVVKGIPWKNLVKPLEGESYAIAKLRYVIEWVASSNPIHILQSVLSTSSQENVCETALAILEYCQSCSPDFDEAIKVLSFLRIPTPVEALTSKTVVKNDSTLASPFEFFHSAINALNEDSSNESADFTRNWPSQLCALFRRGKIDLDICSALYSKSGLLLTSPSDYPASFPAPYRPSLVLRYLQYCLIIGAELGAEAGIRSKVREIWYSDSFRFRSFEIPLVKMSLLRSDTPWTFACRFFGFHLDLELSESINAVLMCLMLWHTQKQDDVDHKDCNIIHCPIIIATLLYALVNIEYLEDAGLSDLCDHNTKLMSMAQEKLRKFGSDDSLEPMVAEKRLMHNFHEIIIIYDHFLSLFNLLTGLKDIDTNPDFTADKYNSLVPRNLLFQSLQLPVLIARHLSYLRQSSRLKTASRFWLTNLALSNSADALGIDRLRKVVFTIQSGISHLDKTKLSWKDPCMMDIDPPLVFIPQDERARRSLPSLISASELRGATATNKINNPVVVEPKQNSRNSLVKPVVPLTQPRQQQQSAGASSGAPLFQQLLDSALHRVSTYPIIEQHPLTRRVHLRSHEKDRNYTASISGSSSTYVLPFASDYDAPPPPPASALARKLPNGHSSAYASRLKKRFGGNA